MDSLRHELQVYFFICKINTRIQNRARKNQISYLFLVFLGCLICLLLSLLSLISENSSDTTSKYSLILYLIISFDIIAYSSSIVNKSTIEPRNLFVYPLSKWEKLKAHILLQIFDYKSLLYISVALFYSVYLIKSNFLLAGIVNFISWIFILISIQIWLLVFFYYLENYIYRYRKKISSFSIVPILMLIVIINTDLDYLNNIPIVGQGALILENLIYLDINTVIMNIGYLIAILFIGSSLFGLGAYLKFFPK